MGLFQSKGASSPPASAHPCLFERHMRAADRISDTGALLEFDDAKAAGHSGDDAINVIGPGQHVDKMLGHRHSPVLADLVVPHVERGEPGDAQ